MGYANIATPPRREKASVGEMKQDRRNFLLHSLEGGFFVGGASFVAAGLVGTVMAKQLGAPNWIIGLLPISMFLGLIMAPIFTASFVERSRNMKRISLITGVPQRLTFLIAGLVIILWGDTHPVLALSALVLAPLLSGIFGGIGHGAWTQLVARTVPANRRSSLSATRNVIGTSIGVVAGFFIQWLLNQYDGTFAFGLLHIIAFGFMMLSYFFFSRIQEVIVEPVIKEKNRSLREYVDELWAILRVDRNFRHFAIMRVTGPFGQFVSPYMTIYAIDVLNASAGFAGTALIVTNIGQYLGNAIGGILGDRLGGRLLLVSARTLFLASFIFATTAESYLSFLVYFFVSALATSINGIGNMTLMMEIAPDHRRPTYGALNGLLNGPSMLILSLVGAVYWSTYGAMQLQALIATAGMIVSMYFIWKVKEPRLITPNP